MKKKKVTQSADWLTSGYSDEELLAEKTLAVIAADIQLKRIEKCLDQKQFARLLGVSPRMVARWESGTYNFTITTLINICEKLDLSFKPQIMAKETFIDAPTVKMSVCGDCQFFEKCSKVCIGLDENESFPEIGGCETFQPADDKTKQYRKVCKQIIQYVKENGE